MPRVITIYSIFCRGLVGLHLNGIHRFQCICLLFSNSTAAGIRKHPRRSPNSVSQVAAELGTWRETPRWWSFTVVEEFVEEPPFSFFPLAKALDHLTAQIIWWCPFCCKKMWTPLCDQETIRKKGALDGHDTLVGSGHVWRHASLAADLYKRQPEMGTRNI